MAQIIKRPIAAALITTLVELTISSVFAQTGQQLEWCVNKDNKFAPNLSISGCTAAIQSGKNTTKDLNWAFYNRGNAHFRRGDYDRAIADYTEAIRFDSNAAHTFNNRGNAYFKIGDHDRAIADYNEAIRLNPRYARAFNNRGNAYRAKGDYDRANADLKEAILLGPELATVAEAKREANTTPQPMRQTQTEEPTGKNPYGIVQLPKAVEIREPNRSQWIHNDSIVFLIADGTAQKIYFESPRIELVKIGVKSGTLLFEGQRNGLTLVGTMYRFYRTCKSRGYRVSGNVSEDGRQITLKGEAPLLDSNCNVALSLENVLIFVVSQNAPSEGSKNIQGPTSSRTILDTTKPDEATEAIPKREMAPQKEPAQEAQITTPRQ